VLGDERVVTNDRPKASLAIVSSTVRVDFGVAVQGTVGRRVEQSKDRLNLCSDDALGVRGIEFAEYGDPDVEVGALEPADRLGIARREIGEVVILDADEVTVSKGEISVERDERAKRVARRRRRRDAVGCLHEVAVR
jgi:hypothetical protein